MKKKTIKLNFHYYRMILKMRKVTIILFYNKHDDFMLYKLEKNMGQCSFPIEK